MALAVIISALALFGLICLKRVSWGIYIIALLLPSYLIRFEIGKIPFTFLEGMIWIAALSWLAVKIFNKKILTAAKEIFKNKFFFPALLLLLASTLAVFISPDKTAALGIWKAYFVAPIILYFIFISSIKTRKQIDGIIWALIISAAAVSLITVFQYFTGMGIPENYNLEEVKRATAIYRYPAAVGLFVAPILSLLLGLRISNLKRKKEKIFLASGRQLAFGAAIFMLMLSALFFAKTEGALVSIAAVIFFSFLFTKHRLKVAIIYLFLIAIILIIPIAREYFLPIITFQDVSGDVRLAIWQGTARLIANHPIFGAGLAGFPYLYEQYKEAKHVEISLYPHNIFLNFWVETGILGLLALILIIVRYFREGLKKIKRERPESIASSYRVALMAVMICILVYGLVDVPYFKNDLAVLFWIWVGMMGVSSKKYQMQK